MKLTTLGIDLAKSIFRVHGVDARGVIEPGKPIQNAFIKSFNSRLPEE